jgi:hypothetical protein
MASLRDTPSAFQVAHRGSPEVMRDAGGHFLDQLSARVPDFRSESRGNTCAYPGAPEILDRLAVTMKQPRDNAISIEKHSKLRSWNSTKRDRRSKSCSTERK